MVSIWLSSEANTPVSSVPERVRSSAVTFITVPALTACCNSPTWSCGMENTTSIGVTWVIRAMPLASLGLTTLPMSTARRPTRPLTGATTRV